MTSTDTPPLSRDEMIQAIHHEARRLNSQGATADVMAHRVTVPELFETFAERIRNGEIFREMNQVTEHETIDELHARIRRTYRAWQRETHDEWMSLAELRKRLGGNRQQQNAALRHAAAQPGVHIIPVANQKALTDEDRAAALRLGGEDNHALMIDR